jgi:holo-[acyl-carrier protein] synthase
MTVIGVGIDAVDVPRLEAILARREGMAARLFTDGEARAAAGSASRLGARFAAKEAVMKALGVGLGAFGFHDVEVVREASGAPRLVLRGGAAALAAERGVRVWHVSLTHTATLAHAVVIAES